jgi:hypothetical protein
MSPARVGWRWPRRWWRGRAAAAGDVDLTVRRRGEETTVRFSARRVRGLEMAGLAAEIERLGRAVDALARPDGDAEGEATGGPGRRE